jgi:hypothetical protein
MGKVEVAVILSVNIENTGNKKDLPKKQVFCRYAA